jgi:hypothetical protein
MPTTNKRNRSGGHQGNSGGQGGNQGGQQGKGQQGGSQAAGRMTDMREQMADYVSQGTEKLGQMTRGHEGQAVLIALATGFGIGFVIGCSLASSSHEEPRRWSERFMAEGLGRKLMQRMENMMPEMISEHFHR